MKLILACLLACTLSACATKKAVAPEAVTGPTLAQQLLGSEWRLEDLGGTKLIPQGQASIAFPEPGRITGMATCNRFVGPGEIRGDSITVGPLAVSRRRCKAPLAKQEAAYLKALNSAQRIAFQDSTLQIYCEGMDQPLLYTRKHRTRH